MIRINPDGTIEEISEFPSAIIPLVWVEETSEFQETGVLDGEGKFIAYAQNSPEVQAPLLNRIEEFFE